MRNSTPVLFFLLLSALSWYVLDDLSIRGYVVVILALVGIQLMLNDALESYLVSRLKSAYLKILIAPGTIVHELSHALLATLAGCRISRISLFRPTSKDGVLGFVEYREPKDRYSAIRGVLVAFAPLAGCGLLLIAVINYLALNSPGLYTVNERVVDISGSSSLYSTLAGLLDGFFRQLIVLDLSSPVILLLLYLELSFALGSAPSPQDISSAARSVHRNKIAGLVMLLSIAIFFLAIEYSSTLGGVGETVSEGGFTLLKWMILVLLISSAMLFFTIPLAYLVTETLLIKGLFKLIPLLTFVIVSFAMSRFTEVGTEKIFLLSLVVALISIYVLRHPGHFIK